MFQLLHKFMIEAAKLYPPIGEREKNISSQDSSDKES